VALQIEAVRGIGLDEKSIKEAYSFGERVRDQGFRKLMLPFYLTEKNKVHLTQANIRHLVLMALRYSHLRQMIRAPNERLFNSDQCLLLAVFPRPPLMKPNGEIGTMSLFTQTLYSTNRKQVPDKESLDTVKPKTRELPQIKLW
jgi:hypothetical protein